MGENEFQSPLFGNYLLNTWLRQLTLEFLINVDPQINVGPGKFGKNNKRRPPNI